MLSQKIVRRRLGGSWVQRLIRARWLFPTRPPRRLKRAGYARPIITKSAPDLALMDIRLPGISGPELRAGRRRKARATRTGLQENQRDLFCFTFNDLRNGEVVGNHGFWGASLWSQHFRRQLPHFCTNFVPLSRHRAAELADIVIRVR